jgi:hypothetical protein
MIASGDDRSRWPEGGGVSENAAARPMGRGSIPTPGVGPCASEGRRGEAVAVAFAVAVAVAAAVAVAVAINGGADLPLGRPAWSLGGAESGKLLEALRGSPDSPRGLWDWTVRMAGERMVCVALGAVFRASLACSMWEAGPARRQAVAGAWWFASPRPAITPNLGKFSFCCGFRVCLFVHRHHGTHARTGGGRIQGTTVTVR